MLSMKTTMRLAYARAAVESFPDDFRQHGLLKAVWLAAKDVCKSFTQ